MKCYGGSGSVAWVWGRVKIGALPLEAEANIIA
jgi:hypothetical protein